MNSINVTNILESLLLESAIDKVIFNGIPYKMELDATEAPTKEGIRIKFTPMSDNVPSSKADITNLIKQRLNSKLEKQKKISIVQLLQVLCYLLIMHMLFIHIIRIKLTLQTDRI